MHSLLERYLADFVEELTALPTARREEEVQEMRLHLTNATDANQKQGQSPNDAAANALQQFGTPKEVGKSIAATWRRGELLQNRRSLLGASVCALVLTILVGQTESLLAKHIFSGRMVQSSHAQRETEDFVWIGLYLLTAFVSTILVGGFTGVLFPRRAATGTILASAVYWGYLTVQGELMILWQPDPFHTRTTYARSIGASCVISFAISTGIMMIAARIGSRWQNQRLLRNQQ